jgi:hypothetical protein
MGERNNRAERYALSARQYGRPRLRLRPSDFASGASRLDAAVLRCEAAARGENLDRPRPIDVPVLDQDGGAVTTVTVRVEQSIMRLRGRVVGRWEMTCPVCRFPWCAHLYPFDGGWACRRCMNISYGKIVSVSHADPRRIAMPVLNAQTATQ